MGSTQAQGQVWGVQARNWADMMEKMVLPIYHVVLDKTNVCRDTRLLDIGCGTGMAAQLVAKLGAAVRAAGEETIKQAVLASLVPFKTPSGGYRQENLIHYAIATA